MTILLPPPLDTYMAASARLDAQAILDTFSETAVVSDEHRSHRGREALRVWIEEATIGNKAVPTPLAVSRDGGAFLVTAEVNGEFPGSPVTLSFRFELDGDRIAALEIG